MEYIDIYGRKAFLILLKLGGSLITEKTRPHTHIPPILDRLANEIAAARERDPEFRLVIGHGSGSFGHIPASKHRTRQGVRSAAEWQGFAEVWREARALNEIVIQALAQAGLPVIAFPPSACILAQDGQVLDWDLRPFRAALEAGLIPVVNGDTVFDTGRGGTILSTEDVFLYLARQIPTSRILLAGSEDGVWQDFPGRNNLIPHITPRDFSKMAVALQGSFAVDVTGGMLAKVESMLALAAEIPGLEVLIFSGLQPGAVREALLGDSPGTRISGPG
jgi:isopentenyl phosphate kinase